TARQARRVLRNGAVGTGSILPVRAGNRLEQDSQIDDAIRHWPRMIHRVRKRQDAVTADAAVGRLAAWDAAEGSRSRDRAARLCAECSQAHARGNGGGGAATRAARRAI